MKRRLAAAVLHELRPACHSSARSCRHWITHPAAVVGRCSKARAALPLGLRGRPLPFGDAPAPSHTRTAMSDQAQQSILQELERLLPHIRRLEFENKATADEKTSTTEAAIGKQLAKVLDRDAANSRENVEQHAARERVAAAEAARIIEAIQAAPQAT